MDYPVALIDDPLCGERRHVHQTWSFSDLGIDSGVSPAMPLVQALVQPVPQGKGWDRTA